MSEDLVVAVEWHHDAASKREVFVHLRFPGSTPLVLRVKKDYHDGWDLWGRGVGAHFHQHLQTVRRGLDD